MLYWIKLSTYCPEPDIYIYIYLIMRLKLPNISIEFYRNFEWQFVPKLVQKQLKSDIKQFIKIGLF